MSQYINEAFKQFRLLESEDFNLSPEGLDTLDTFMNQAMDDEYVDVYDLEAEAEEDLKKSYIGKVICDCNVCHSNIFYNKEDIVIDEEGIVNIEDECPYCMSLDGYTIVGEIKPYEEGVAEEEPEDDVDLDVDLEGNEEAEEPIEIEPEEDEDDEKEDDDLDESLQLSGVAKLKGKSTLRRRDEHDGCKCILGRNNTELSGDKDLHESIELGDDGQTIWAGVPVREDSIANNPHKTNMLVWADDDEEWYIDWLVRQGIPDEQLCHEFYTRGWNSEDAIEEYKKSGLSLHESINESTKKFEIVSAGQGKWKVLKNSIDGGRVSEDSRIVIDADTKEEAREILLANGFKAEELLESVRRFENDEHIYGVIFDDGSEIKLPGTSKEEIARRCESEKDRTPVDIIDLGPNDIFVRGKGNRIEKINPQEVVFRESIENVSIDTEDETMTMTTKEDGGVVIETSPKEEFEETFGEDEPTELEAGDEMIAPLEPETEDELGISDESEEDMDFDFGEETSEEPEEDVDIDEFDEETFDGLGESYLRRCYENVKSFNTTGVTCNENLLTVEGNITFKSGNVKKTSFIFEAKESNNGKYIFEGYNNEINIGKKAFRLNCSIDNKKIIPESLSYNYRSKNELNESVKVHGTVKAPKRG